MQRRSNTKRAVVGLAMLLALGFGQSAQAASNLLFSNTSDNSGVAGNGLPFKTNLNVKDNNSNEVTLDNVLIAGMTASQNLRVNKVEYTLFRRDGSPTSTFEGYYGRIAADRVVGAASPTITTPIFFGSKTLSLIPSNGTGTPTINTQTVTFGDGSTTLFTLGSNQINRTDQPGNGEFVLGFRFIQTQASAYVDPRDGVPYDGVKLAKPDAGYTNPMEYFSYSLTTLQQNAFAFFASPDPNTGAGVYVRVWGETFTPEPATIGLAGWAGVFYLARRPSRRRVEKLSRIAT